MSGHSDLAEAIAFAEGFGKKDAIPTKAHNPGDLAIGDIGYGTLGAEKITIFQDDASGWAALEHQLDKIRKGTSAHYRKESMSIQDMANKWTGTQKDEWAHNVSLHLTHNGRIAVPETKLKDVL